MNVRCGKGRKVHVALFHPLGGDRYIQTGCGMVGSLASHFGYEPWMKQTEEIVTCGTCLRRSTANQDTSYTANQEGT